MKRTRKKRTKPIRYRISFRESLRNMGLKARVALIGSILAFLVLVSQASGILKATYHTVRPYADRATEILVSGWQYDRTRSELRDVNERIRRLEERKKILAIPTRQHPRGKTLHKDDVYELGKLYRDQRKLNQVLQYIDKTQRPYAK